MSIGTAVSDLKRDGFCHIPIFHSNVIFSAQCRHVIKSVISIVFFFPFSFAKCRESELSSIFFRNILLITCQQIQWLAFNKYKSHWWKFHIYSGNHLLNGRGCSENSLLNIVSCECEHTNKPNYFNWVEFNDKIPFTGTMWRLGTLQSNY